MVENKCITLGILDSGKVALNSTKRKLTEKIFFRSKVKEKKPVTVSILQELGEIIHFISYFD